LLGKTHSLAGWSKDVADHMDSYNPEENKALKKRRSRANSDGEIRFYFQLASSIFQIREIFLSKVDVSVTLHKNSNKNFYMMHNGDNQTTVDFEIQNAVMVVRKLTMDPDYALAVEKLLNENQMVQYTLNDPRVDVHQISSGVPSFHKDHITYGNLPRRLLVGFVETEAYNGVANKNPFNFKHFAVKKISLLKDGVEYPRPPIICDFGKKDYADAYYNLLCTFHADNSPFTMDIKESDLENGFFFAAWEFSPDQMGGDIPTNLVNEGTNIHLSVEFESSLQNPVSMIVYYELNMNVSINQYRQVIVENN